MPAASPECQPVELRADDDERIVADHWPAPGRRIGVVLAHGFTGHAGNADIRRIVAGLRDAGFGVLAPDARGHGRSGGLSTAGVDEVADVRAAVAWLRAHRYDAVGLVGFSMGGTTVLRYAGLGGDADVIVSVSAPATLEERGTRPMRLVHWMFEKRTGRALTRLVRRTRVATPPWPGTPEAPADVVADIAPRPLLLVHGTADHYFPISHIEALATAAPDATVWIEPGMGHAEVATTGDLVRRIASWIERAVAGEAAQVCDDGRRD